MPDRGEFVVRATEAHLGIYQEEFIDASITQLDSEIGYYRKCIDEAERRKARLEAQLRAISTRKQNRMDARLKVLEMCKQRPQVKLDRWLESRADILGDCDWESPEEGVRWVEQQKVKAVR